jgi:hypothetical protein
LLGGNPATPPRFRRPGAAAPLASDQPPPPNKFMAPTRIGATPIYGSPNGLGAGDTRYDSSNTPRSKKNRCICNADGIPAPRSGDNSSGLPWNHRHQQVKFMLAAGMNHMPPPVHAGLVAEIDGYLVLRIAVDVGALHRQTQRLACSKARA